jgi:hypothetical protein
MERHSPVKCNRCSSFAIGFHKWWLAKSPTAAANTVKYASPIAAFDLTEQTHRGIPRTSMSNRAKFCYNTAFSQMARRGYAARPAKRPSAIKVMADRSSNFRFCCASNPIDGSMFGACVAGVWNSSTARVASLHFGRIVWHPLPFVWHDDLLGLATRGEFLEAAYINCGGLLLAIIAIAYLPASCYFTWRGRSTRGGWFSLALGISILTSLAIAITQWLWRLNS